MNGLANSLDGLAAIKNLQSRSICGENLTGNKGEGGMAVHGFGENAARDLGQGWKVSPSVYIEAHSVFTLANIDGEGAIKHIWMTPSGNLRYYILRFYYDGSDIPSVECPLCDFFASTHIQNGSNTQFHQISSLAVCNNPRFGMNCYWTIPFKKGCRITVENLSDEKGFVFYQIDYVLGNIGENTGYFHARFNRINPLPYKTDYTILDGVEGKGHYVGTYMLWGVHNSGWWGEGEIKFFLDGDEKFPTICGTGTEDYFGGAYNFDDGGYKDFCTPYSGMTVIRPDGVYNSQMRFSMYRWHITDPIYFDSNIRVTIQALGWRSGGRYLPLCDDISSVAFWYQDSIQKSRPEMFDRDFLEII